MIVDLFAGGGGASLGNSVPPQLVAAVVGAHVPRSEREAA